MHHQYALRVPRDRSRLEAALGPQSSWSRSCLLPYPRDVDAAIDALADAARSSDQGAARRTLAAIDDGWMRSWFCDVASYSGIHRSEMIGRSTPRGRPTRRRSPRRGLEYAKLAESHHRCWYCGIRLAHWNVLGKIRDRLGHDVLPWGRSNAARHGLLIMIRANFDHVQPLASSGRDDADNIVASCWCCNYGKWRFDPSEVGLTEIRREPWPSWPGWDGLSNA